MRPEQSLAAARTILVVEDETLIRTLVAMELEDAGYSVQEAASADEALRLLERIEIDLVITDIQMPGTKNGLEVAAWLRVNKPCTKVIVMSGFVHDEVLTVAAQYDAFLRKPFQPSDMLQQAKFLLGLE